MVPAKESEQTKKKRIILMLILHQIMAQNKIVDKEKSKNKLPSPLYDDFHAHLIETNLKTKA